MQQKRDTERIPLMYSDKLFDCQNIREACDLEDFLNVVADIADRHGALLIHDLLGGKQRTKSG